MLVEILEAQKQRVTRLGLDFTSAAAHLQSQQDSEEGAGQGEEGAGQGEEGAGQGEEGCKEGEEFDSCYLQVCSWAEHVLSRLQEGQVGGLHDLCVSNICHFFSTELR